MRYKVTHIINLLIVLLAANKLKAQEYTAPLMRNPALYKAAANKPMSSIQKTTALGLPFFEDFTNYSLYPDTSRWDDNRQLYINNTMCVDPISRGVATFDALGPNGLPYNTQNNNALIYADSLASKVIDLSTYQPSDSVYLSFFYQPQGNGFYPEKQDSLMLYLRDTLRWRKVWSIPGDTYQPFQQVMIAITAPEFFHPGFRMMFVNKATINTNDDNWNLDYIKLDANRSINDVSVDDVAFSSQPSSFLGDYTSMPYHQFLANSNGERAPDMTSPIRNNYSLGQQATSSLSAREVNSNTPLFSGGSNTVIIGPLLEQQATYPVYTNTVPQVARNSQVIFENKFMMQPIPAGAPNPNDTIIRQTIFHNYLAYDDGTAEKSYYVKLFATLPGKTAIKYHLNEPDTMTGMAIYFGRQVPVGNNKSFSISVYQDIAYNGGTDKLLRQQDYYLPGYLNINEFYYYKLDTPVILPQGDFYAGIIQPALSNSDSLYLGLDVNRTRENHLYFNVVGSWQSSGIAGAVMMRPVFGSFFPSSVSDAVRNEVNWDVNPNPATANIFVDHKEQGDVVYNITDLQGRIVMRGKMPQDNSVDVSQLLPGIYFMNLIINGQPTRIKKVVKL